MPKRNGLSRSREKQGLIPIDKEAIKIVRLPEKIRKAENEKRLNRVLKILLQADLKALQELI